MDLLTYYFNNPPKNEYYVQRKQLLPLEYSFNLYGVRGSGKSTLILDFIEQSEHQHTLYIDCEDPNLYFHTLKKEVLEEFLHAQQITLLVLDHYRETMDLLSTNVTQLVVISHTPCLKEHLSPIELFPLDYEEFLAFESSSQAHQGFNHFLRVGTLPLLAKAQKNPTLLMKLFFQTKFTLSEQRLLLILAKHHTNHITIHQIYTFAKEQFKVSKDWVYKTIKAFEEEKIIFFIPDLYKKSGKKLILFDFAFAKYLHAGKPFFIQFDSMIALAFMKHKIAIQALGNYGYLTQKNELIMVAPFESEESLWVKSQNNFSLFKKYHIQKVTILTVTNHYTYQIEKITFEALPFDEWSVINEEEI